jgi:hypothetical protein
MRGFTFPASVHTHVFVLIVERLYIHRYRRDMGEVGEGGCYKLGRGPPGRIHGSVTVRT